MSIRKMVFSGAALRVADRIKMASSASVGSRMRNLVTRNTWKKAIEYVAAHPDTLLVLSGRDDRYRKVSEAESALALLDYRGWYEHTEAKSRTIVVKLFAKTSFENVYFSIAAYRHHVGEYPARIGLRLAPKNPKDLTFTVSPLAGPLIIGTHWS